jgi:hypothetical protein
LSSISKDQVSSKKKKEEIYYCLKREREREREPIAFQGIE